MQVPADIAAYLTVGYRYLMREPERSRRAARLLYANWLAHVEFPEQTKKKPVIRAMFISKNFRGSVPLYAVNPLAPQGARRLAPRDLASWLVTCIDAKPYMTNWNWPYFHQQAQREHRLLVVTLAEELYRRERGVPPRDDQALVGTYLSALPDDGLGEVSDDTTPFVDSQGNSNETQRQ